MLTDERPGVRNTDFVSHAGGGGRIKVTGSVYVHSLEDRKKKNVNNRNPERNPITVKSHRRRIVNELVASLDDRSRKIRAFWAF